MKQASIVTIGNEILAGLTVDTNSAFLAIELKNIGIPVVSTYTVGDEIDDIVQKLNLASSDADVIIVTGGLGPTDDDITRQGVADYLGVELELREELLERLREFFKSRNIPMPEKNRVQAYIPSGAAYIPNVGTAPGILARHDGKILVALPGVPWEADKMFRSVIPELKEFAGTQAIEVCRLKCFGLGESMLTEKLGDKMLRGRNPLINCTVHEGIITLHIVASAENREKAKLMLRYAK